MLFAGATLLPAEEAEVRPAMELMELINIEGNSEATAIQLFGSGFIQLERSGVPEEGIEELTEAAKKLVRKAYVDFEVKDKMAALYEEHFTGEEIRELVEFYRSDLGKKMLAKQKVFSTLGTEITMGAVQADFEEIRGELATIAKKYVAALAPPAENTEDGD